LLLVDPYVLVVPSDSPLAGRNAPPTLTEVSEHPLISYRQCRTTTVVENALRQKGDPNVVFRSDDNGTVQGLVAAGVGIALVPRLTVQESLPNVEVVDMGDRLPPRLIGIGWHRDRYRTPAARAFVETAREVVAGAGLVAA
jgi:DNA-binding transcriptional LysR family regulator